MAWNLYGPSFDHSIYYHHEIHKTSSKYVRHSLKAEVISSILLHLAYSITGAECCVLTVFLETNNLVFAKIPIRYIWICFRTHWMNSSLKVVTQGKALFVIWMVYNKEYKSINVFQDRFAPCQPGSITGDNVARSFLAHCHVPALICGV